MVKWFDFEISVILLWHAIIQSRNNQPNPLHLTALPIILKVFMKRNFLPQFFDCIRKISSNHNISSLIEFFKLSDFSRYSILFDMKITQPVTSLCIITFEKSFIDLKNTQNITLKYLGLYVKHILHTCKCSCSYFHY